MVKCFIRHINLGSMNNCTHHWLLPTSGAYYIEGVCKYCSEKKNMVNSLDGKDLDWKVLYAAKGNNGSKREERSYGRP